MWHNLKLAVSISGLLQCLPCSTDEAQLGRNSAPCLQVWSNLCFSFLFFFLFRSSATSRLTPLANLFVLLGSLLLFCRGSWLALSYRIADTYLTFQTWSNAAGNTRQCQPLNTAPNTARAGTGTGRSFHWGRKTPVAQTAARKVCLRKKYPKMVVHQREIRKKNK